MSSNSGTTTISSGSGSTSFGTNSPSTQFGTSNSGSGAVNSATLSGAVLGAPGPRGPAGVAEVTATRVIAGPATGRYYLEFFDAETTIDKIMVLLQGTGSSLTYNIRHGGNFQGAGTQLFAADQTETSTSTGTIIEPASMVTGANTLVANSHLWLDITATTADAVIIALFYTPEATTIIPDQGIEIEGSEGETGIIALADLS